MFNGNANKDINGTQMSLTAQKEMDAPFVPARQFFLDITT
jgi:hypothetical protein